MTSLAGLARSLADLRTTQQRLLQAAAAREAAAGLAVHTVPGWEGMPSLASGNVPQRALDAQAPTRICTDTPTPDGLADRFPRRSLPLTVRRV